MKFYLEIEKELLNLIREFSAKYTRRSLVKTLLVFSDYLFFTHYQPQSGDEKNDINSRSIENLCTGVSYLIYFYTSRFKTSSLLAAEEYIINGSIGPLLQAACNFLELREYEILIEHFGYQCHNSDYKLIISAPFPDLEKSIRLGYIRTEIQHLNDLIRMDMPSALSLNDLVDKIIEVDPPKMFEKTTEHGYPRYRVMFTKKTVEMLTEHFVKPDEVFLEEVVYLGQIIKEQLLSPAELRKIAFKDNLTVFEFLKARRWFLIMSKLLRKYLEKQNETDPGMILRTLVMQLTDTSLHELLDRILTPDQVDTFLDCLSWTPGAPYVFDIQYQPLILIESHYEIPLYVFSDSNAVRNLYAAQYKQANKTLMKNGHADALVDQLVAVLNKVGLKTYSGTTFDRTDIDVCCVNENILYVFECKHTLHPVSVFDLRTMYDYIRHAEHQLQTIEAGFNDGKLLDVLQRKCGIPKGQIKAICPCLIVSNRLLNGDVFQYPVRFIKETENLLLSGEIATPTGVYSVWPDDKLTPSFMHDYFSKGNTISRMHFDCLSPKIVTHKLFHPRVEFHSFSMRMEHADAVVEQFVSGLRKVRDHDRGDHE